MAQNPELPEQAPEAGDPTEVMTYRCARCETEYEGTGACPACGLLRDPEACEAHPQESARGRCVICGRTVCEGCQECGTDPYLCAQHAAIPIIQGWAQVYTTSDEFEMQLLRDNLQAEGVDAQIYSQKSHTYPVDMGDLAVVRLMVPVWEYERAQEVVRGHMDTEGEVLFACPNCGEAYEAGAAVCGNCGSPLA
ncbi:MAG: DUF2007 domain-containing protein [Gemmatimonadota bacterium]|nr:DUF2007 domain-containing protein [Gemmatimonadota bacterium]